MSVVESSGWFAAVEMPLILEHLKSANQYNEARK